MPNKKVVVDLAVSAMVPEFGWPGSGPSNVSGRNMLQCHPALTHISSPRTTIKSFTFDSAVESAPAAHNQIGVSHELTSREVCVDDYPLLYRVPCLQLQARNIKPKREITRMITNTFP